MQPVTTHRTLRSNTNRSMLASSYDLQPRRGERVQTMALVATALILVSGAATAAPSWPTDRLSGIMSHTDRAPDPQHTPLKTLRTPAVPTFISSLYNCWSSGTDCPDELDVTQDAVDRVGSFVGIPQSAATRTLYSHNMEEVSNLVSVDFSTGSYWEEHETLVTAEVRLFREALSEEDIAALEAKCDLSSIELELLRRISLSDNADAIVVLDSKVSLSKEKLTESQSIVFKHINQQYKYWIQSSAVTLSVAMGGSCRGVSPSEFGLNISTNKEALIIGYYNKQGHPSRMQRRFARDLQQIHRAKREVGSTEVAQQTTDFTQSRCELHNHTVSFSDFGPEWAQIIVTPKNYSANYCAGHCRFPVTIKDNVTKHSYLQSLANLRDPDVVPEPCCVPIGLVHTYVIVKDTEISGDSYIDSYVVDSWRDTRALACGCR